MLLNKCVASFLMISFIPFSVAQGDFLGLKIEDENRCSPYDKKNQYPYSQSVESKIILNMNGLIYSPYTGIYFESPQLTDIEHIISTSEAHDSGLCNASKKTRRSFSSDILNLTLASPKVNRCSTGGKCGFDASEWLPDKNKCWFADRVVKIKSKYSLSVDYAEAAALSSVLSQCDDFDMIYFSDVKKIEVKQIQQYEIKSALTLYDDNNNGRITCAEAIKHGVAPVYSDHPAYEFMRDSNRDGVVCE